MAEIKNVGAQLPPVDQSTGKIGEEAVKLPNGQTQNAPGETAVGRGNIGQPVGLPESEPTTQNALMPNVVTGRDPSQLIAAEKMRSNGGHSATEVLLGLNQQPSATGMLLAPPGNLEALRHLTPAMRRNVLRNLLAKQRGQMRRVAEVIRDDGRNNGQERENQSEDGDSATALQPAFDAKIFGSQHLRDLEAASKMLDMLDELLGMQDYTLSQIGTFAQG